VLTQGVKFPYLALSLAVDWSRGFAFQLMELLTRQQAEQIWFKPDPTAQFDDLLEALGLYKDISTEYGLNQSVQHQWRFGDPHKKSGEPDRHDYEIKVVDGKEVAPGPAWHSLYCWVVSQAAEFLAFQTVNPIADNRDRPIGGDCVQHCRVKSLAHVAAWWKERIRYVGPYGERTTVVFVHISAGQIKCALEEVIANTDPKGGRVIEILGHLTRPIRLLKWPAVFCLVMKKCIRS